MSPLSLTSVLDSGLRRASLSLAVVQGKGKNVRAPNFGPLLQVLSLCSAFRSATSLGQQIPKVALVRAPASGGPRPSPLQPGKYFLFLIWPISINFARNYNYLLSFGDPTLQKGETYEFPCA